MTPPGTSPGHRSEAIPKSITDTEEPPLMRLSRPHHPHLSAVTVLTSLTATCGLILAGTGQSTADSSTWQHPGPADHRPSGATAPLRTPSPTPPATTDSPENPAHPRSRQNPGTGGSGGSGIGPGLHCGPAGPQLAPAHPLTAGTWPDVPRCGLVTPLPPTCPALPPDGALNANVASVVDVHGLRLAGAAPAVSPAGEDTDGRGRTAA